MSDKPVRPQAPISRGTELESDLDAFFIGAGIRRNSDIYARLMMSLESFIIRRDATVYNFASEVFKAEQRDGSMTREAV